jgi:oligopeptidase A
MAETTNPLLDDSPLPHFDAIRPEDIEPGIQELLAKLGTQLLELERAATPTWAGLIEPLERIDDELSDRWRVVSHLTGVANSEALRAAYAAVEPKLVKFAVRFGQSRPVYDALCALRDGDSWQHLDSAQQRIVTLLIRDAQLAGVGLDGKARERFNAIQTELADLSTRFSNNVLDATKAFATTLATREEVAGLPESALQLAAQSAREAGNASATPADGPWRITLDQPSFEAFMHHSRRRDLREQLYRAYITRASDGDLDNAPLITQILKLRREAADLLGFGDYADLSLATKMAPGVEAVEKLLEELRVASFDAAHRDLADMTAFAAAHPELQVNGPGPGPLAHWDLHFWAERLREARYDFSEEELRKYFPLPRVLDGMFGLAKRLFGVDIREADGEAPVWHADVRFFKVFGEDGEPLAAFYLDPYARPAQKRGGAWMNECTGRSRLFTNPRGGPRLPIAYLVCNQSPPVDGQPSLMRFREVETLFHEFGHGLQHMLTQVDYGFAAGIHYVERDAIELPSQFMENWCYHRETLLGLSGHVETGAKLPDALYEKLCAARTFRAGSFMLRQLYFGLTDLALHHGFDPDGDRSAFDVQRQIAEKASPLPPVAEDRFLCSFAHIFAGGYAAGYFSYKWAEVLSADAFAAFEEAGLEDETAVATVGRRFRDTVLGLGGSRPAMDIFTAFRGREPDTAALLRHNGLKTA